MIVLTVNTGSTSVKLAAFEVQSDAGEAEPPPQRLAARHLTGQTPDPAAALRGFLGQLPSGPAAVVHRVVHGGTRFTAPTLIDDGAREAIAALSELAPLHNPVALRWIDAARECCGAGVTQVAAFDTAFFSTLPRVAAEYAMPPDLGVELGVRRYGFHGLAHQAMYERWRELEPRLPEGGKLITLQLGGGCSMAALDQGRPRDTSMGFSPLEGLVMETRSGDIDAAVVPYLERRLGMSGERVLEMLNERSGLAGVAGSAADPQALLDGGSVQAQFAVELYCYRARKYLGAYLAVLGGCDGIAFGGGVGEHVAQVRARILSDLEWAGIELDHTANQAARGRELRINAAGSRVSVWVIPVDEELLMVRGALTVAKLAPKPTLRTPP
ncbi:MAG TPA: acetate/propionate family kinase [Steroidobacteraceae bacterium]|jgi:acetate kinase|nr:acetate/propionate family kinase [Steroidobacteraceae bacterium]